MKIGGENKKSVYALIVLGVFAGYMVYSNLLSGPSYPTATPAPTDRSIGVPGPDKTSGPDSSRAAQDVPGRSTVRAKNGEFRPVLRPKKKEDRVINISTIDPTLRLDLLAKVMKVPPAGGERDLFQISKTPPVKLAELPKGPETKIYAFVGPRLPPPPAPPPPPPPPTPPAPIPLKYYGYSAIRPDGKRTAYFMDGEDILEAIEGTTLKGRYRIVQIGLDKVLVEDTLEKRRQSVNIEPEVTG
jgi:hypothetical protein